MILYSYGGLIAQALPEYDRPTFQYAFVAENAVIAGAFALFISDKPFAYDRANGVIVPSEGATVMRCAYVNDSWSEFVEHKATELLAAQWANLDIPDTDGNEWLAGSVPLIYDAPMIVTHDVTVDVQRQTGIPDMIHAVQDDQYSRDIRFTILRGGMPWQVPVGTKVTVRFAKVDGTGGNYDTMPDGSNAYSIDENRVTVKLAPQVLTCAGRVSLCVSMESGGTKINTFVVVIDVQRNPGITAASANFYKLAGTLSDAGWAPNMILGTDENGNVIAVENPVDRMEELVAGINAALDELIGEEVTE